MQLSYLEFFIAFLFYYIYVEYLRLRGVHFCLIDQELWTSGSHALIQKKIQQCMQQCKRKRNLNHPSTPALDVVMCFVVFCSFVMCCVGWRGVACGITWRGVEWSGHWSVIAWRGVPFASPVKIQIATSESDISDTVGYADSRTLFAMTLFVTCGVSVRTNTTVRSIF